MNEVTKLTKKLIAIPSISGNEAAIMDFVATWGKQNGFEVLMQNKDNVTNIIFSIGTGKRTIILTTHLDTVSFSEKEWKITHPHTPVEKNGYLFGLGANDAKGIAASMLMAAKYFQESSTLNDVRLIIALVSQEETSGLGTKMLVPFITERFFLDRKNTLVIVGEPTGLNHFSLGNKGNAFIQIIVNGESSHASRPHEGHNAAKHACDIIAALPEFEKQLNNTFPSNSGRDTIAVTALNSHLQIFNKRIVPKSPNTIPDQATITLDLRVGETLYTNNFKNLHESLDIFISKFSTKNFGIKIKELYPPVGGHEIAENDTAVKIFKKSVAEIIGETPTAITVSGSNDAPFWGDAGFTVINEYGPGDRKENHTHDEKIKIEELEKAPKIYLSIARKWLAQ